MTGCWGAARAKDAVRMLIQERFGEQLCAADVEIVADAAGPLDQWRARGSSGWASVRPVQLRIPASRRGCSAECGRSGGNRSGRAGVLTYLSHRTILVVVNPDSVRTSIDVPRDLHRHLHEVAARKGCSARQLILRSIERAVAESTPKRPTPASQLWISRLCRQRESHLI